VYKDIELDGGGSGLMKGIVSAFFRETKENNEKS
jgi:hypothetical protein